MIVVVDSAESVFIHTLVVFAITLTLTKAKILNNPRAYVNNMYELTKRNGRPSFIHTWWHSMWHCGMCSGFWVSLITTPLFDYSFFVWEVLIAYSLNWLLHCIEDCLFYGGKFFKSQIENK